MYAAWLRRYSMTKKCKEYLKYHIIDSYTHTLFVHYNNTTCHSGVTKRYRRHGVGRYLMTSLLDHVTSTLSNCWAVYLHVMYSNTSAIGW